MEINVTKLIEEKRRQATQLKSLRPKIERLAAEARAAEMGKSTMAEAEWGRLRKEVEDAMVKLGLATPRWGYDPTTNGHHFDGYKGMPRHWSQATVT